jgi:hypothetical protein
VIFGLLLVPGVELIFSNIPRQLELAIAAEIEGCGVFAANVNSPGGTIDTDLALEDS